MTAATSSLRDSRLIDAASAGREPGASAMSHSSCATATLAPLAPAAAGRLPRGVRFSSPAGPTKSADSRMFAAAAVCDDAPVTVLIVDDHPSFRATARALLQAEGFDVVGEAEDGASALALVAELRPDVVLLDVQLPDLDGFEVAQRLGADGPAVVLVSSRDG